MRFLPIAFLLALSIPIWAEDAKLNELLPEEAYAKFQAHARDFYFAANKLEADLQLSIPDERVLLHLPKRGFPHLASLAYNDNLWTLARSALFSPDRDLKTHAQEEAVAEELFGRAMVVRLAANNYACFQILKELAPTSEAMKFEAQAKQLSAKLFPATGYNPTEAGFLQDIESVRVFFDQLKDLPKLTAKQLADERADSAAIGFREYGDQDNVALPRSGRRWLDRELKWHRKWDHQGYLLAFSETLDSQEYAQLKMIVNLRGGIFEWSRSYAGSHFHPDSYESKLPEAEFLSLKDFLTKLPPSDAEGEKNHFVVSFLKDGQWRTRTYNSLPSGSPFEGILTRTIQQSTKEWQETLLNTGS